MNILIDNHHPSLTHSLELLLGKRLGHRIVYPIGREWYERGFFRVFSDKTVVDDYLSEDRLDAVVKKQGIVMTGSGRETVHPNLGYCPDIVNGLYQRAVRFEDFIKMPFDAVIASVPAHVPLFARLIREYKPEAKLVFQMGNMFEEFDFAGVKNLLNSTDRNVPAGIHSVRYSQEFDTDLFRHTAPIFSKKIMSFINYGTDFAEGPGPGEVMRHLPAYTFEGYGSNNACGVLSTTSEVAQKMTSCDFVWHVKKGGDGYGHVLHNAAALGRPVILSAKTYEKLRFGKFVEDGVTCVSVDGLDAKELAEKIHRLGEPDLFGKMSRALRQRFEELVDFEKDAQKVGQFLEILK